MIVWGLDLGLGLIWDQHQDCLGSCGGQKKGLEFTTGDLVKMIGIVWRLGLELFGDWDCFGIEIGIVWGAAEAKKKGLEFTTDDLVKMIGIVWGLGLDLFGDWD